MIDKIKKGEILKDDKKKDDSDYASKIVDGVEVVDVKAIPAKDKNQNIDKFGIPIPENRKTWDKI